jgi:hypothetical protein
MAGAGQVEGRVAAIRGAVVDLVFEDGPPPINDAVEIADSEGRIVIAEIQAQLDARSERAIALEPTTGLRRGDRSHAAGGPVGGRRGSASSARRPSRRPRSTPSSARMRAMTAAKSNVSTMLDDLVARSRQLRQKEITNEIIELGGRKATGPPGASRGR